jgi:hypothetical protein
MDRALSPSVYQRFPRAIEGSGRITRYSYNAVGAAGPRLPFYESPTVHSRVNTPPTGDQEYTQREKVRCGMS